MITKFKAKNVLLKKSYRKVVLGTYMTFQIQRQKQHSQQGKKISPPPPQEKSPLQFHRTFPQLTKGRGARPSVIIISRRKTNTIYRRAKYKKKYTVKLVLFFSGRGAIPSKNSCLSPCHIAYLPDKIILVAQVSPAPLRENRTEIHQNHVEPKFSPK